MSKDGHGRDSKRQKTDASSALKDKYSKGQALDDKGNSGGGFGGLSFGFAASKPKKQKVNIQVKETKKEKKFVTSINENKLKKLTKEKKKQIVIPLIKKNVWRPSHLNDGDNAEGEDDEKKKTKAPLPFESTGGDDNPENADDAAAKAIMADLKKREEEENAEREIEPIPLLLQNAVPGSDGSFRGGDDDRFKTDVELRPEADEEGYERVPVEDFGKAMLLGMGWKPGKGIGKTNVVCVEPIQYLQRGYRMGLAATESKDAGRHKKYIKPGESREKKKPMRVIGEDGKVKHYKTLSQRMIPLHSTRPKVGKLVEFLTGAHARLYGRITEVGSTEDDPDDQRLEVKLNLNDEVVKTVKGEVKILDEHALPKDHPAFLTKEKAAAEASAKRSREEDEPEPRRDRERGERSKHKDKDKHKSKDKDKDKDKDKRKRKEKEKQKQKNMEKEERITWVVPHIRVRVACKRLANGKYYQKKARVDDVVSPTRFTLQMADGKLVEGVKQKQVHTALPKKGGTVLVLKGEHKGEKGELLVRDSAKDRASVQLEEDSSIVNLSFDDVAEYCY